MPPISSQSPVPMSDYQNFLYYNQIYTQMCGFPPFFQQYMIEPPKTLEESLNCICQRGIVNNIIGAFFIKEIQEKMKNNEKRKVPISMVEFSDDQGNNNSLTNNNMYTDTNMNNGMYGNGGGNDVYYSPGDKINNDNYTDNKGDNVNNNINNKPKKDNINENGKNNIEDKTEKEKESNTDNYHENQLKKPDLVF
jgi:hypothetical protein